MRLDYEVLTSLGESLQAEVFVVQGSAPGSPLRILKKIRAQYQVEGLEAFVRQQIEQLSELELPKTSIPELHRPAPDALFLVREYLPGRSLTECLKLKRHSVEDALEIAIFVAERLEEIHKAGHIHKGIKPNNILVDEGQVRLIDDVRTLDMNQISHFIYDDSFRVSSLPYLAPEQTGRIKYSVNYTADLYALGTVLYECLVGYPPFLLADPLAIIHSHLAEMPKPLREVSRDIPPPVSAVVDLLLQKAPEKRYQTAIGLKHDLEHCLRELRGSETGKIFDFALRQRDFSNRITIPSLMVGRDQEKRDLLDEYRRSCSGVFRAALISGLSGIGKTRLIQELQLPIVATRGYYTSGKFDQFQKHIPYSTLIQALTNLVKTILTEDSQRLVYWKERMGRSLGDNGRLITDLVPELALIVGQQGEVPELPPVEARNRFNDTAGKFIACLASDEHPLTLFIDDLQWCDGATFDLLEKIFDNPLEYPSLLWIGAYRHNEVDKSHRLSRLIDRIKNAGRSLLEIQLEALGLNEVNQMTAYILNTYPTRTKALSEVIYQTSSGNPLFVNESLRWLHHYRHLHLAEDGTWNWDDDKLRHAAIPDSALDLFKDKIAKLPSDAIELLEIAASLGARFDAADLAVTANLSLPALYNALGEVFAQNILSREKDQLYFFHDQVQAAAESFMSPEKRRLVHARIASAFVDAIPEGAPTSSLPNLFAIVEHLAEGRGDGASRDARVAEARFNYHAGITAMNSLAMENANYFFQESLALYPTDSWDDDYEFLFSLHKYLARTAMAIGRQPESEAIINTLIQHSRSDLDKADCLYEQTTGLSSMGKFKSAIDLGNRALAFFDRCIPADDQEALKMSADIVDEIHGMGHDIWQAILDVRPSEDRATKIETGIYSELIPDYYLAGMVPQLYLSAIQSTQNCLAGGVDETVIYGFSMVGLYLQRQGKYDMSFRYEDLGLTLAHRYPDTFGATKGINGILWTNMHNRRGSEHIIEQCQQNIHRGKNCGDLYNAGLSYGPYIWHLIARGHNFEFISDVADECVTFSGKFNLSLSLGLAQSAQIGWSDLMNPSRTPRSPEAIAADIDKWEGDKHVVSIGGYYTLAGISHYYLGNYELSADFLHKAEPYLRGLSDNILNRLWYVFSYVNTLRNGDSSRRAYYLEFVETWAGLGPILKPYLAFMEAEQARDIGDFSHVRRAYLDAIDSAQSEGFLMLEGYLHECLGQALIDRGHQSASDSLNRAMLLYRECGATAKEAQLLERYSLAFSQELTASTGKAALVELLDVNYLVEATRAITKELEFDRLLITIVQAVMERLGAKTGYLFVRDGEDLTLFAKGVKRDAVDVSLRSDGELSTEKLSMAIVNYAVRAGETVILENASGEGDFVSDARVYGEALRSVLCIPLLRQQLVIGVLYLENSLIKSVFTREQIELARLLTAQAAIALENTMLIAKMKAKQQAIEELNRDLEDRVVARTASLNRANEELKHFAYVVSHDLKAPLRAINQLSGWLADDYAVALDDGGREQLALLQSRARRMHDMIDGILKYSRAGQEDHVPEPVNLGQLLAEIIDSIAPPASMKISIESKLPTIMGDRLKLYQVFQNLFDNAIKYNDKEQGEIQVSFEDSAEFWSFCVGDNGPGVEAKYQERIFQLFQTLAPKDKYNSTGVGLSLIKKIVGNWGGRIWLESKVGAGSRFHFTLPKQRGTLEQ